LLACSLVLYFIYRSKKRENDRFFKHWAGLSLIFLILSMEEVAGFHESIMIQLRETFHTKGYLTFPWVVPGLAFCVAVFFIYLRFLLTLERPFRFLFLLSGGLYVGGGLGLEFIAGNRVYQHGWDRFWDDLIYALISNAGEAMEMLALSIFLYALLCYTRSYVSGAKDIFE
jgi:hypothetical protein